MTLDPERDLQRIHFLIMSNIDKIELTIKTCEHSPSFQGTRNRISNGILDYNDGYMVLKKLWDIVWQIEQKHRSYQRTLARDTRYGSK